MTCNRLAGALLVFLVVAVAPAQAHTTERTSLEYSVAADPVRQIYRVTARVDGATEPAVELRMPAWQPASYVLQPYADAMSHVEARDTMGARLAVSRPDGSSWRVRAGGRPFVFSYVLDASERQHLASRSYLYASAGALQAGASFPYLPAHRGAGVRISLELPAAWQVATPMPGGPRTFEAADYDELVDSPLLFGELRRADFDVRGIPFAAVWDARLALDEPELVSSLSRMADVEIGLFGSAPFDRYMFLYLLTPDPSGNGDESLAVGVEHARSTLITIDPALASAPLGFKSVLDETNAHELFHAWNVKAIHPESLERPDYASAPRVASLWLLEGVTSYYADRVLATIDEDRELAEMQLRMELAAAASLPPQRRSVEQIALDAPRAGLETMLPLYTRGEALGLLFDVEIRGATANRAGLDDVMRLLYARSDGGRKPFRESELPELFSKVAGRDLSALFRRHVSGTEPIPLSRIETIAGWRIGDAPIPTGNRHTTVRAFVSVPDATPLQRAIQEAVAGSQ